MPSVVSRLSIDSHPQKAIIIRRIIDGLSIRQVIAGVVPPVSEMTVHRYKSKVIMPILAKAGQREGLHIREKDDFVPPVPLGVPLASGGNVVERVTSEALNRPVLSVFRQRLEKLNGIIDRTLNKAESSVRIATDKDGNQVVVGADIGVMAPLLNQAHKNVEMLGRATGELEPQGGGSVSIQILCPAAGTTVEQMPRITYADTDANVIEGTAVSADELDESAEIGVLQG